MEFRRSFFRYPSGIEPSPRRFPRLVARGAAWLTGPLLALSGLSEPADQALGQGILRTVTRPLPARETAIVVLPEVERGPDGEWHSFRDRRVRLPPLVRGLVAAGVRSISLDIALHRPDPADGELAEALQGAATAGVPVVLPLRWVDSEGPILPDSAPLVRLITTDAVHTAHAQGEAEAGRALDPGRIRLRTWSGRWYWHAAVETVASWSPGVGPPRLEREGPAGSEDLVIGPLRAPSTTGRISLRPVEPSPCWVWVEAGWATPALPGCVPITEPAGESALRGRAVWIGVRPMGDDRFHLLGEPVAGVDIQAAATEVLAAQASPRATGPAQDALLAGVTAALVGLGRRVVSPGAVGVAILAALPIGGLLAASALGWLVAPVPVLVAAAAGLIASRDLGPSRGATP